LIAKNLLTGSLKHRSIDNLETQKKSISMKNSQFCVLKILLIIVNINKDENKSLISNPFSLKNDL
jgi:hypothetical protein